VGVWTLRPGIGYEGLCRRVEERLLKYSRFRQRVIEESLVTLMLPWRE